MLLRWPLPSVDRKYVSGFGDHLPVPRRKRIGLKLKSGARERKLAARLI